MPICVQTHNIAYSDMAPNACGISGLDHQRIMVMCTYLCMQLWFVVLPACRNWEKEVPLHWLKEF